MPRRSQRGAEPRLRPDARVDARRTAPACSAVHALRPEADRAEMAGLLARKRDVPGRDRHREAQVLRARHVPLPVRRRAARRAPRGLHATDIAGALQAHARLQRAAPDGLGRLRPARRAVRDQDGHPSRATRPSATSTTSGARSARSASPTTGRARSTPPIPTTSSGPSGSSASSTSAGLAYEAEVPGELVPGPGHGAGERGGDRRQERGGRPSRRAPSHAAVDAAHHAPTRTG